MRGPQIGYQEAPANEITRTTTPGPDNLSNGDEMEELPQEGAHAQDETDEASSPMNRPRRGDSRLTSNNDSNAEDAGNVEGEVEQSTAPRNAVPATVNEVSDLSPPRKPSPAREAADYDSDDEESARQSTVIKVLQQKASSLENRVQVLEQKVVGKLDTVITQLKKLSDRNAVDGRQEMTNIIHALCCHLDRSVSSP